MATMGTDASSYLSTAEAARRLGLSARSVRRAAQEGRLAGQLVDGRWWVDEDAVAAMAEAGQAERTPGRDHLAAGTAADVGAALSVLAAALAEAERRAATAEAEAAQLRRQLAQLGAGTPPEAADEGGRPSVPVAEAPAAAAPAPAPERAPWWRRWWAAAGT